jgi:hypothetical protein
VLAVSWLFLALAVVTLLLGLSREGLFLIYVSIGSSVAATVALLAGLLRRPRPDGPF